ncbi:MAG: QueT transporter family protein [Ruminococcaceae bacterium]|nr:QueT transporter family protein [Oscillospiraceae bacterium]
MQHSSKNRQRVLFLTQSALIAALYTVLTMVIGSFGLASGAIQVRVSEALCILPIWTAAAIPGLTVGCFLSNLLMACLWQDVLFGSLATLLGALGAYLLRRRAFLTPLPTVLANTLIVPPVLAYAYGFEGGLAFFALTVGLGEVLSAYCLGMLLYFALKPHAARLFRRK